MRYLLSLLILTFTVPVCVQSNPSHIETIVSLTNENGDIASVKFGLDSNATYGLDPSLEFSVPGFPPTPMGLQALLTFSDSGNAYASYAEFRPFSGSTVFSDTFHLIMTPSTDESRGKTIVFKWTYPLDNDIDSIVISDLLGGTIKRFAFDSRRADTISGNAWNLESYRIIVFYNLNGTAGAVDYANDRAASSNGILVPSDGWIRRSTLNIDEAFHPCTYSIYSSLGQLISSGSSEGAFDCNELSNGVYTLAIFDSQGRMIRRRILR